MCKENVLHLRAPIVQRMNNAINWISFYPVDNAVHFVNTCD